MSTYDAFCDGFDVFYDAYDVICDAYVICDVFLVF